MKDDCPKISIVIPAYNAANYLAQAIESALGQTYANREVIVVNDGSRDDGATRQIALSYGDRIRYVEKENGGSSSALNAGIAAMTGEWFSWLSHDDLYLPDKLERQVETLRALAAQGVQTEHCVLFSSTELIDKDGRCIRRVREKAAARMAQRVASAKSNVTLVCEPTAYSFYGCSCLVHRSAFAAVGGFEESLRLLNDMDMWYRLYVGGYRVVYDARVLVQGRVHAAQISKSIGYSYHNAEQDMFWARSLDWLLEREDCGEEELFRFCRNAYLKTRDADGDRAFAELCRRWGRRPYVRRAAYRLRAKGKTLAKRVYLTIKA